MEHWRGKAHALTRQLEAIKAVQDINTDTDWWREWQQGYLRVLLPLIDEAAEIGAEAGASALELTWALGVDADVYNPEVADWARRYAGDLAKGLTRTDKMMLRRNLSAWVESHEDFPSLVSRVNKFLESPARARRISVTEATRCYAEGNMAAWRASEVVTGKIHNTARDELVCPLCSGLDGQVSEIDGQTWYDLRNPDKSVGMSVKSPPLHPG
jgi:hypothetical protein